MAICLLHADLDAAHEVAAAAPLRAGGWDVTCSHEVSPEFREYERTVTTVVNAMLRPRCRAYLRRLASAAGEVAVMSSAGGLMAVLDAAERPVALLLSGPAGGVRAAAHAAAANGHPDAVTFDMGGTSTDVCLVRGGRPEPAAGRMVGGYPVRVPSLDVHTIGAGGGSIARIDAGGALVVGPASAGAEPGPACYGRGGEAATVTDADLVLGRIPVDATFGDLGRLDPGAARSALSRAGVTAEGVVRVVDTNMELAVRRVTVERGVDPRGLALVAFGGAGPLHACALADALGMSVVVVPDRAGVLSAAGILTAPARRDLVRSWPTPSDHRGLEAALAALAADAEAALGWTGVVAMRSGRPPHAPRSTAATAARATSSPSRPSPRSRASTVVATATSCPTSPSRWWRCGPRPSWHRPSTSPRCRAVPDAVPSGRPCWRSRTARSGCPRGGGPIRARAVRSSCAAWAGAWGRERRP